MKKYLLIPVLALVFGAGVISAQNISFPDVKTTDWFYKDVMNMVDWGVIKGNDDGTFKPNNNVNRAELSAMWNRYDERVLSLINGNSGTSQAANEYLDIAATRLDNMEFRLDANRVEGIIDNLFYFTNQNPSFWCDTDEGVVLMNEGIKEYNNLLKQENYIQEYTTVINNKINSIKSVCSNNGYTL